MKKWHYPFLAFLIIGTILILTHSRSEAKPEYRTAQGLVFGTSYHITYLYNADLQEDIEHTLALVDNALSMFNPNSTISAVNRSESVFVDDTLFLKVFRRAMEISDLTGFSISFISDLENGKSTAEIGKAIYLANVLGLDIDIKSRGRR